MANEEYEILPHEELQKLREEVEELKRNPMGNVQESEDLKSAMSKLTRAMHHLIDILSTTNDEMVSEFKRTTMSEHFEKISDQNEKIANALLHMVELQDQHHQPIETPPQTLGQDNIPGMHIETTATTPNTPPEIQQAPPIEKPVQEDNTLPGLNIPPPIHHEKKKGLASLFKK